MPERPAELEPLATEVLPWWTRGEYAWGTALGIGFVATWIGLLVPVPGFAALLAVAALAPLHIALLRRERRALLALTMGVWALGCLAAVVGVVHEAAEPSGYFGRLPGAEALSNTEFGFLRAGEAAAPDSPWATLPRDLGLFVVLCILARPLWSLSALLLLGLYLGAVGGALGSAGFEAGTSGLEVLRHAPPHLVLLVLGAVGVAAGIGEEEGLPRLAPLDGLRRRLLGAGFGAAALALVARGPLVELWRGMLAGSLEAR